MTIVSSLTELLFGQAMHRKVSLNFNKDFMFHLSFRFLVVVQFLTVSLLALTETNLPCPSVILVKYICYSPDIIKKSVSFLIREALCTVGLNFTDINDLTTFSSP